MHEAQHGLCKIRSEMIELLLFLDRLYQKCDHSTKTELYVLYLDFRKAFDSVPHQKLIDKI